MGGDDLKLVKSPTSEMMRQTAEALTAKPKEGKSALHHFKVIDGQLVEKNPLAKIRADIKMHLSPDKYSTKQLDKLEDHAVSMIMAYEGDDLHEIFDDSIADQSPKVKDALVKKLQDNFKKEEKLNLILSEDDVSSIAHVKAASSKAKGLVIVADSKVEELRNLGLIDNNDKRLSKSEDVGTYVRGIDSLYAEKLGAKVSEFEKINNVKFGKTYSSFEEFEKDKRNIEASQGLLKTLKENVNGYPAMTTKIDQFNKGAPMKPADFEAAVVNLVEGCERELEARKGLESKINAMVEMKPELAGIFEERNALSLDELTTLLDKYSFDPTEGLQNNDFNRDRGSDSDNGELMISRDRDYRNDDEEEVQKPLAQPSSSASQTSSVGAVATVSATEAAGWPENYLPKEIMKGMLTELLNLGLGFIEGGVEEEDIWILNIIQSLERGENGGVKEDMDRVNTYLRKLVADEIDDTGSVKAYKDLTEYKKLVVMPIVYDQTFGKISECMSPVINVSVDEITRISMKYKFNTYLSARKAIENMPEGETSVPQDKTTGKEEQSINTKARDDEPSELLSLQRINDFFKHVPSPILKLLKIKPFINNSEVLEQVDKRLDKFGIDPDVQKAKLKEKEEASKSFFGKKKEKTDVVEDKTNRSLSEAIIGRSPTVRFFLNGMMDKGAKLDDLDKQTMVALEGCKAFREKWKTKIDNLPPNQ